MQIGTKVMRKADFKNHNTMLGTIEEITGNKAKVLWVDNGCEYQRRSTIKLLTLVEITPKMERDIRARQDETLSLRNAGKQLREQPNI